MSDDNQVHATLEQLHASWPKPPWTWDGRFSMVSSAVSGDDIAKARTIAEHAMPHVFDVATVASAPAVLRALLDGCGGVRGNQLVLCDDADAPIIVGLWWPWGGGGTVSLRVGLIDPNEASTKSLRAIFSIG